MKYKVSIIIPIYNVALYIEESLKSALNQTFKDIEYILVDDKGTDDSMIIARNVIEKSNRKNHVRIIEHISNQGLGATRNTGINEASGEYAFFLDSDDSIAINAIESLYNAAVKSNADLTIGSYTSVDKTHSGQYWEWKFEDNYYNNVSDLFFGGKYYVMTWNKLYKKSLFIKNKIVCIPNNNHEDEYFAFQVALHAKSIATVSDITYFYSFRENSIMNKMKEKNYFDHYQTIIKMQEYSILFTNDEKYSKILNHIYGNKLSLLLRISKSLIIDKGFQREYMKKFGEKFLPFNEIWMLRLSLNRKLKFSVAFLPAKIQLFLLKLIMFFSFKKP